MKKWILVFSLVAFFVISTCPPANAGDDDWTKGRQWARGTLWNPNAIKMVDTSKFLVELKS